jgi:hypothetical protein
MDKYTISIKSPILCIFMLESQFCHLLSLCDPVENANNETYIAGWYG